MVTPTAAMIVSMILRILSADACIHIRFMVRRSMVRV